MIQPSENSPVDLPTPGSSPLLESRHLVKRYEDDEIAVNDVSFSVRPGEIYAMLGRQWGR